MRILALAALTLACAAPALAQSLPTTSRAEQQTQSINRGLEQQGQIRGIQQQNQFETNQLRGEIQRNQLMPPGGTGRSCAGGIC